MAEVQTSPVELGLSGKKLAKFLDFKNGLNPNYSIWGIPLSRPPAPAFDPVLNEKIDIVLLNFLQSTNFSVCKAIRKLKHANEWRSNNDIDTISQEPLDDEFLPIFNNFAFQPRHPPEESRPAVIFWKYGAVNDVVKARQMLLDDTTRARFVRWRIQRLERAITESLDFTTQGASSLVEVSDVSELPDVGLDKAVVEYEELLVNYYPGIIGQRVYINAYLCSQVKAFFCCPSIIPADRRRKRSTFIHGNPAKTLCRIIPPHLVPLEYGGMCERTENPTGIQLKASTMDTVRDYESVEIRFTDIKAGTIASWELLVIGWDVGYAVEFQPVEGQRISVAPSQHICEKNTKVIKGSWVCEATGTIIMKVDNSKSDDSKIISWRCYYT